MGKAAARYTLQAESRRPFRVLLLDLFFGLQLAACGFFRVSLYLLLAYGLQLSAVFACSVWLAACSYCITIGCT
jgi:hypothetical protein